MQTFNNKYCYKTTSNSWENKSKIKARLTVTFNCKINMKNRFSKLNLILHKSFLLLNRNNRLWLIKTSSFSHSINRSTHSFKAKYLMVFCSKNNLNYLTCKILCYNNQIFNRILSKITNYKVKVNWIILNKYLHLLKRLMLIILDL